MGAAKWLDSTANSLEVFVLVVTEHVSESPERKLLVAFFGKLAFVGMDTHSQNVALLKSLKRFRFRLYKVYIYSIHKVQH